MSFYLLYRIALLFLLLLKILNQESRMILCDVTRHEIYFFSFVSFCLIIIMIIMSCHVLLCYVIINNGDEIIIIIVHRRWAFSLFFLFLGSLVIFFVQKKHPQTKQWWMCICVCVWVVCYYYFLDSWVFRRCYSGSFSFYILDLLLMSFFPLILSLCFFCPFKYACIFARAFLVFFFFWLLFTGLIEF